MELKGRICWLNRHAKRHADVSLASLVNEGTLTPRIQWDMSEDHFGLYADTHPTQHFKKLCLLLSQSGKLLETSLKGNHQGCSVE